MSVIDQVARDKAQRALEEISSHEKLCVERYDNINDRLSLVLKVLGWGGATIMTVLLGIAARSLTVTNNGDTAYLRAKVDLLEQQLKPPAVGSPDR